MTIEEIRQDILKAIAETDMIPVRRSYGKIDDAGRRCGCALSILAHHDKVEGAFGLTKEGFYRSGTVRNHASKKYGWDLEQARAFINGFDYVDDGYVALSGSGTPEFELGKSIAAQVIG